MTVWMLRRASRLDLAGIMALEQALFSRDAWSEDLMCEEIESLHTYYLVAERHGSGGIVGYAGLSVVGEQGDIQTIAVAPPQQGRGLGRTLMTQLISEARQRGATELFLEVRADNPVAQGLYRSLGFEQISVRRRYYQPDDVDALVFRLDIVEPVAALAESDDEGNGSAEGEHQPVALASVDRVLGGDEADDLADVIGLIDETALEDESEPGRDDD